MLSALEIEDLVELLLFYLSTSPVHIKYPVQQCAEPSEWVETPYDMLELPTLHTAR
jgi:hypothetical protein